MQASNGELKKLGPTDRPHPTSSQKLPQVEAIDRGTISRVVTDRRSDRIRPRMAWRGAPRSVEWLRRRVSGNRLRDDSLALEKIKECLSVLLGDERQQFPLLFTLGL
jgi:hypothetical protein